MRLGTADLQVLVHWRACPAASRTLSGPARTRESERMLVLDRLSVEDTSWRGSRNSASTNAGRLSLCISWRLTVVPSVAVSKSGFCRWRVADVA